ncbi:MAG: hypothetical protein GY869_03830, partial [Planctomycetes bacterium]|nr:hypothetical protein [Planctomycetota bacterium]
MAILFLLGLIWSQRLPVSILGQADVTASFENLLDKAKTSLVIERWSNAGDYYEQALPLAEGTSRDEIIKQIRWCRVQQSIQDRYLDGSLASYAGKAKPEESAALLAETMELVKYTYYEKIDPLERLTSSLYYLEATVQNKTFRDHFSVEQESV